MVLLLLKRAWPYLVCLALGFATCWYTRPATVCPATVDETVQSQTMKREVVTVDRIVTRTVKPDGTVVERQEDKQQTLHQDKVKTDTEVQVAVTPSRTRYSLGLDYLPSFSVSPSWRDTQLEAGARLGDSDAWAIGGYDFKYKQAFIGLRYEW